MLCFIGLLSVCYASRIVDSGTDALFYWSFDSLLCFKTLAGNYKYFSALCKFRSSIELFTGVIPISLFLLATGTVLRKAAIDRGVRLATGRYGCRYRGVTS